MYARTERTDRLQNVYAFYIFYSINKETLWLPIRKDSRVLLVKCTVTKIYICIWGVIWSIDILRSSAQKSLHSMKAWESEISFFLWQKCVYFWLVGDLRGRKKQRWSPKYPPDPWKWVTWELCNFSAKLSITIAVKRVRDSLSSARPAEAPFPVKNAVWQPHPQALPPQGKSISHPEITCFQTSRDTNRSFRRIALHYSQLLLLSPNGWYSETTCPERITFSSLQL